jgi:DnaJ-class molecular chaperone
MLQPVAVCEVCGDHARSSALINEKCAQFYDGFQCRGMYVSRLNYDDWAPCPHCRGTGEIEGIQCATCEGDGLVDVRPAVPPSIA